MESESSDQDSFIDKGWLLFISSSVSAVATLFIIIMYFARKKVRSYGFTLIFGLCISDLGLSISLMSSILSYNLSDHEPIQKGKFRCNFFGATKNFFVVGSLMWTIAISKTLYDTLINKKSIQNNKWGMLFFVTFGFSALNTVIPLGLNQYIPEPPFIDIECTIDNYTVVGSVCSILNYIIYFWIAFFYNFVTIYQSRKYFRMSNPSYFQSIVLNMLFLYPMSLFLVYAPIMISRSLTIFGVNPPVQLYSISYYTLSLSGLSNFLVYGYFSLFKDYEKAKLKGANEKLGISQSWIERESSYGQDFTGTMIKGNSCTSRSQIIK